MAGTEASLHHPRGDDEDTSDQAKPDPSSEQALSLWYDGAWGRLNSVPDSTDKYKSTCSAVHQLQHLIQEVSDKREECQSQIDDSLEISFKFDSLVRLMSSKQEQLFQGVVHFHTTEIARIGAGLDQAERKLAESPLIKGYAEQQRHLHKLKDAREDLSSYQSDLQQLVDAPTPMVLGPQQHQQQVVQQEQVPSPLLSPSDRPPFSPSAGGSSIPVFSELKDIQSKAQLLSLRCQQLCQNYDDRLESLENELETQSDKFLKELEGVEQWIQNAYSLLRQEPTRVIEGIYSQDEMDAEEAEVMDQRSRDSTGSSMGGGSGSAGDGGHQFGYGATSGELFSSGEFGSLGSEGLMVGSLEEVRVHDTSVDPDLSDDEYGRRVIDHVISPSPEPVEGEGEGEGEGEESSVDQIKEYEVGFGMSATESDGEEDGSDVDKAYEVQFAMSPEPPQQEEEETTAAAEGGSVVSESTLRDGRGGDQETSVDKEEGEGEGEGASTVASTEQSEAITQETRSTSTSSKYSINWVKGLGFVKMYHDAELDAEVSYHPGGYQPQHRKIDSILEELTETLSQIPVQSQKVKRAKANTNFVIVTASKELAGQLQHRLQWVNSWWDRLQERLKRRKIQLTFEKAEKAVLESIAETCQELKEQPDGVLLMEEMESKRRDLMDFIVDMEQYSLQMSQQLKELDDSFAELKGVCQEEAELLEKGAETVRKLRKAYEDVAGKVKEQQTFLDESLLLWSKFQTQCVVFEDWLSRAEELVNRDSYGYTLKETEDYCTNIKQLKEKISVQEHQFSSLVEHGRALLESMDPQTEAEQYMDGKLSTLDQRWTELVSQDRGSIDTRLAAVDKVLISWRGYAKMRGGTQSFVSQMTKMVGTEPLESSHGDQSLLPTYMTYAGQLKSVEVQYGRVMSFGEELVGNPHVGGGVAIKQEIEELRMKFEPLKDNVVDSLELLKREYNEWIMVKLHQMSALVSQANEITERELRFIAAYPLSSLLETEAGGLLQEAKKIMDNLDQVNQMEADCTVIEEGLLERQIEHETSSSKDTLEFPTTLAEKQRLQEERERLLGLSDTLEPVLRVCYQQLQILGKVQEGSKVVVTVKECVGRQDELETLLVDAKLKLSEDMLEGLRGEVYDLGTITEVLEGILSETDKQISITLPSYDKVVEVNRSLTESVERLSDEASDALGHLQLILEWWAEFTSNHGDMTSWLEGMEEKVAALEDQLSSAVSPRPCPLTLQQTAKDICDEVDDKSVVVRALSSTGESLLANMKTAERSHDLDKHINDIISSTKTRWEELKKKVELRSAEARERGERFESFIDRLTDFTTWLSEFYSSVYEEFLERIPPKASDEIIAHHRTTLRRFFNEAEGHQGDHDSLEAESEEWAEHLIPEEFQENLLSPSEPSPPPFADDDFPPPSLLPYVKRRTTSILDRWDKLQRLLREREQQLEMSSGSMQDYLENLQNLLNWMEGELQRDSLTAVPPAHAPQLKGYLEQLQTTGSEFSKKQSTRAAVEQLARSLKSQVAPGIASTIDTRMGELTEKWRSLEEKLSQRKTVLSPLLSSVEAHCSSCSEFESWLDEQEGKLEECGPIGADLNRLKEQTELLKQLDEGLLERKGTCGDLHKEALTVAKDCSPESLSQLKERVSTLDSRYSDVNQRSLERAERCEEALAAMQAFQKKVDAFVTWLEGEEKKLELHIQTKKPIGIIQSELETFYDFMAEVEQHSDDYNDLIPESRELGAEYKPSTALDNMMEELRQRWTGHVEEGLLGRCDQLLGLLDYWQRYEKEVKDLLSWIMDEANRFSKEVTTRGDKGIEDHIESCKIFTETLQNKKSAVEGIEDLADLLRAQDGEKKNGTSDVESRWKDVNQHWNSLCKLLQETLLRLEATYAEVRHVLQIRTEEFDWLDNCEHIGYMRRPIRGNLDTVQQEIESHEESLVEVEGHESEADFIKNTVPFLVEHSRKAVREEIKLRAEDFSQRYHQLREFLGGYVGDLKDSIPFWKEFNSQTEDLGQWLTQANEELESDRTQPGNATVTENSLRNTHELQVDIGEHQETVEEATRTGNALKRLVGDEDQQYISEVLERLKFGAQEVEQEAEERVEQLEERCKSWKVFPVEEARVVQEFLSAVEGEVEEEISEEMTADQLLEKLERLEILQETQSQKEGEVQAIDQSADSEEVKKALKKNPDISKERNNLLQGWSSVSGVLKNKIASMRKRAAMMKSIEDSLKQCERGLKEFKVHLDTPLPSPLLLANQQRELSSTSTQLHNQCRASLNDLKRIFTEYATPKDAELAIPAHLQERGNEMEEEFNQLVATATERTALIDESVSSWGEFSKGLEDFQRWLRTASSELSSLKAVEKFAAQFSDLEDRLQMLTDDMIDHEEQFERLKKLNTRLTAGDGPDMVEIREQFERCEKLWTSLQGGVDALPAAMEPWKRLTNQHDELEYWFSELEKRASRDLNELGEVHDETTDVCDHIYKLKSHMEKLSQQAPELQDLQQKSTSLLTEGLREKHAPVKTLYDQCQRLEPRWEELQGKMNDSLHQLENRHAQWRSDAITSIQKHMEVRLQLDELRDEKDREILELKQRLEQRSTRPPARRQTVLCCDCDGWKIAAIILFVMVILLVLVLVGVITFQVIGPEMRPI